MMMLVTVEFPADVELEAVLFETPVVKTGPLVV